MRTIDRVRSSSARPASSLRVVSMLGMLALLFMLIQKAADPTTWGWLADDERAAEAVTAVPVAVKFSPVPETIVPGPTDADPLEQAAAKELFQALTDGSTQLAREEMPAYWRLFSWAEHQSFADMNSRAAANPVLNQFVQWPEEQRGKLFRLELNVRKVLEFPAPQNSAGIDKVYEVWGFTDESKAWLFDVLTAHLPPGMPIGPKVDERVTFVGYFFKTQGYHAAGAGPKDKSLPAPLLIGRLEHHPDPLAREPATIGPPSWQTWVAVILGGAMLIGLVSYWSLYRPKRRFAPAGGGESPRRPQLDGWLTEAQSSGIIPHEPDDMRPH